MLIVNARRINKNVKVFVLADRSLLEDMTRIMDYGADEFTVKPISIGSLINKVNLQLLEAAKSAFFLLKISIYLSLCSIERQSPLPYNQVSKVLTLRKVVLLLLPLLLLLALHPEF